MSKFQGQMFSLVPKEQRQSKHCLVCNTEFIPNSGVHKYCSESCKGKAKYLNGTVTTESQYKYISGNWSKYFNRLIHGHNRQSLELNDCLDLLKIQDEKCALTGIQLTCKLEKGNRCYTNASIDRIQAGGPYIKENIRLVCWRINQMRSNMTDEEFKYWCNLVAEGGR